MLIPCYESSKLPPYSATQSKAVEACWRDHHYMKARSPNVMVGAVRILPPRGSRVRLEISAWSVGVLAH
jgi:hypothetical protein